MDDDQITNAKSELIVLDWKEIESSGLDEFRKALRKLGIHMYSDPKNSGSDAYVLILTNRKLDRKEVRREFNKYRP